MDEATRKMIVEIWMTFGRALILIFQWFVFVKDLSQIAAKRRWVRFWLWLSGIVASALVVTNGLMNEPFGYPNPLYPWMQVVIVLAYLAVWGYIIKRRSTLPSPKIPK
ncbi:MAG: hypothetical protein K6T71_03335 [Candidatus Bipolaricaulota bacterium]|nr:hypothetical protein [Candidatus Bipolaricaulota bacterium]